MRAESPPTPHVPVTVNYKPGTPIDEPMIPASPALTPEQVAERLTPEVWRRANDAARAILLKSSHPHTLDDVKELDAEAFAAWRAVLVEAITAGRPDIWEAIDRAYVDR